MDKAEKKHNDFEFFLKILYCGQSLVSAIYICCANLVASTRAKNTVYNGKSRHIKRNYNSTRQLFSSGIILIDYEISKENITNPLMKGLSREKVTYTSSLMGLKHMKRVIWWYNLVSCRSQDLGSIDKLDGKLIVDTPRKLLV